MNCCATRSAELRCSARHLETGLARSPLALKGVECLKSFTPSVILHVGVHLHLNLKNQMHRPCDPEGHDIEVTM